MSNVPAKSVAERGSRPGEGIAVRQPGGPGHDHNHVCALYAGSDELLRACVALAREGVAAGLRNLFVFDGVVARALRGPLAAELSDPHAITSAEDLFGLGSEPVSIASVAAGLRSMADNAVAEGYAGLYVLIDMSWMLDAPWGLANQGELEAALHELAANSSVRVACLYNRLTFPANMLLDTLRTHIEVFEDGKQRANPHFLPPVVFLSGDPQTKVDWWLATLRDPQPVPVEAEPPAARAPAVPRPVRGRSRENTGLPRRFTVVTGAYDHPAAPDADGLKRWKIRCLGELRIYPEDGSQIEWNRCSGATYKTKTLFAYLFQRGPTGASAEEAADLLWPEAADLNQSLNRLYHTIHCLRMALSPELTSSRNSPYVLSRNRRYCLALPEGTWVDMPVFEQFCRQGEKLLQAGDLNQSLVCHLAAERLYTGSLFEDIPVEYVEDPERDWCWSKRFWLEEIHLKMLTNLATIYRQRNDLKLALHYCDRVLKADPCLENAHREAMRIYALIGRRDALERQWRMCRESLKRFEDRPPSAETAQLVRELLR